MRVRFGILALVLVATLTGCGGDDKKEASSDTASSSAPSITAEPSETVDPDVSAVPCAKFLEGQSKAAELQTKLTSGADVSDLIDAAAKEFDALKINAPEDIQQALDEVKAAFTELAQTYKNPAAVDPETLSVLSSRLAENAQKLNTYIAENCP